MPRGRTKEILHTSGFIQSPGHRGCKAAPAKHRIKPGGWILTVKAGLNEKSYCLLCARAVLELGRERLDALFTELERLETLSK